MKIISTNINGLKIIEPKVFYDDRGCFFESYNSKAMNEAGLDMKFVQNNHSISVGGVLRGVHLQNNFPQGKLVRCIRGSIWDVAVDLRKGSETFGQWYGLELSSENKLQLYIPENFGHGFLVLSDEAEVCFKVTDYFHKGDEVGFSWDDPEVGISWPIPSDMKIILAEKDKGWKTLKETFGDL
jgi:dTDP-4-dehydrorhamnose 3,5-epimerase